MFWLRTSILFVLLSFSSAAHAQSSSPTEGWLPTPTFGLSLPVLPSLYQLPQQTHQAPRPALSLDTKTQPLQGPAATVISISIIAFYAISALSGIVATIGTGWALANWKHRRAWGLYAVISGCLNLLLLTASIFFFPGYIFAIIGGALNIAPIIMGAICLANPRKPPDPYDPLNDPNPQPGTGLSFSF